MSHRAAGGIGSRNVVSKPVKTGVGARGVNVKWPAQVGGSRGNRVQSIEGGGNSKILHGVRAEPYAGPSFRPAPQGNQVAAATVCGPGGSRSVMRSGQQGTHGNVNPGNPRPNAQRHPLDNK